MPAKIDIPADLADLLADEERVRDALRLLNGLAQLNVQLVRPGASVALAPGKATIQGELENLLLPLPLMFASPIANPAATTASLQTAVIALLTGLRANGQLPA